MDNTEKSKIWFAVINTYAASKKAFSAWEKAELLLKQRGVVYHGNRTGAGGNAMEITFDACMAGYRKFVAVGGDGTVHDVLNGIAAYIEWTSQGPAGLLFSDFTMAVLPVGSGNDWIKTTGVPKDIEAAVEVLCEEVTRTQDVVKVSMLDMDSLPEEREISVSYMANIGGIGIDARVSGNVNAKKNQGKRGKVLYVTSLLQAISERKPAEAKVISDGNVLFDGKYLSMAFGLGKYSGGGMRQTPEAVLDDGLLDVTIIPDIPLGRIAREIFRLFTGTFLKIPEVISTKSKVVTVLPSSKSCLEPVEVDGEVVGKVPVRLELLESRINIVVKA